MRLQQEVIFLRRRDNTHCLGSGDAFGTFRLGDDGYCVRLSFYSARLVASGLEETEVELLVLPAIRKQLSRVVNRSVRRDFVLDSDSGKGMECLNVTPTSSSTNAIKRASSITFLYDREKESQDKLDDTFRILRTPTSWRRSVDVLPAVQLSPNLKRL